VVLEVAKMMKLDRPKLRTGDRSISMFLRASDRGDEYQKNHAKDSPSQH
jgi:hypothetical protein